MRHGLETNAAITTAITTAEVGPKCSQKNDKKIIVGRIFRPLSSIRLALPDLLVPSKYSSDDWLAIRLNDSEAPKVTHLNSPPSTLDLSQKADKI